MASPIGQHACEAHHARCVLGPLGPRPSPAQPVVLNPLRSEDEAFRLLLIVIAVFVVIIALILVARAIA